MYFGSAPMSVGGFLLTDVAGILLSLYGTWWKRIPLSDLDCSRLRACLGSDELGLYLCSSARQGGNHV